MFNKLICVFAFIPTIAFSDIGAELPDRLACYSDVPTFAVLGNAFQPGVPLTQRSGQPPKSPYFQPPWGNTVTTKDLPPTPPAPVPLPAAIALAGSGLLALGSIAAVKKLRRKNSDLG